MNCKHCNKKFEATKNKLFCSIECKNSYHTLAARKRTKIKAVMYKGGKCEECGYNKCMAALSFHHLDPAKKDFGIGGRGSTIAWEKIRMELDKCVLLCNNCHAEEHERLRCE